MTKESGAVGARVASLVAIAAVLTLLVSSFPEARAQSEEAPSPGAEPTRLAGLFEPGDVLQDRNGDELVDYVHARVVLPDSPRADEVAGAAAVAARLGFETSGLTLPLVFAASQIGSVDVDGGAPLIVLGGDNPLCPPELRPRLAGLKPGQGLVTELDGVVVIAGKDSAGTRAAAEAFAARSPYVWEVIGRENGETFERISSQVVGLLREEGVSGAEVTLRELVFEKEVEEAISVELDVVLPAGELGAARDVLSSVERRHRRGEGTDILSYSSAGALRLSLRASDGSESGLDPVVIRRVGVPSRILTPRRDQNFNGFGGDDDQRARTREFDLSNLFTKDGLLGDGDRDAIPDSTETILVLPGRESEPGAVGPGAAHLAARLGLESTGIGFPVAKLASEIDAPEDETSPVLLGSDNELSRELLRLGKRRAPEPPDATGSIEVVPAAFGSTPALVVGGADAETVEAAASYLARRAPHLWSVGPGEPTVADVEEAVRSLLAGRTTAGQAALALARVEEVLEGIEDDAELELIEVEAYFEEASPELDRYWAEQIRNRWTAEHIDVTSRGRREPVEVFQETPEIEWEVDGFWTVFREKALPRVQQGSNVAVELRVSEAPELRQELESRIRAEITEKGGEAGRIQVLSAFKQGLSWLTEDVAPALSELAGSVESVEVRFKPFVIDTSKDWRFYNEPARWLNELYPADEILSEALGLPLTAFDFVMGAEGDESTYTVTARDASGRVVHQSSFSPAVYVRPYHDAFPDKGEVTVTTGWIHVQVDGNAVVDERLPTDLDRIWDFYQGTVLKNVYDQVKKTTGKPTLDKQPFFHTLRFELQASEPDYRLGIDEEQISSLESIHDDVYFDTLDFFYEVVEEAEGKPVASRRGAPGNVLPWIHPERRGRAPELTVTYTENASPDPKVVVSYQIKGEDKQTETIELEPEKLPDPSAYAATVRVGAEELERLYLRVSLEDTKPLERLADLLDNLTRLQDANLFTTALGFDGLSEVAIRLEAPDAVRTRTYASTAPSTDAPSELPDPADGPLVTWDHVISPAESERIAHALGRLPFVTTYEAGRSYQGRPVSVMEITLPMEAELVSRAKMVSWKPVLHIMARQHANEVSSTSHSLKLAELLATDPTYQRYLQKMNVVIQPVVNPDGAALAYELQKLTPHHCLHAGRYSALGPDVPREARNADTLVTEALVLNKVYERWLPDVSLNPHGYPSHEWVQTFANYNPYSFRSYWIPRGWYTSIRPPEDPRFPHHRDVAYAMRDYVASEVSRDPEVRSTNLRIYDRYRRWTTRWQPHVYNLEVHNDTAIYFSRRRGTVPRVGSRGQTTVFSAGTEAMDETAQGQWLDLVARQGFGFLMASVRFIDEAEYTHYRLEEERRGNVTLSLTRPRPLKPGASALSTPTTDSGAR